MKRSPLLLIIALLALVSSLFAQDFRNVEKIGRITHWEAEQVTVQGHYAYVAAGDFGLRILDIADPARPVEVGYIPTPGDALGITVSGEYAYIADSWAGFLIFEISDPAAPTEIGFNDDIPGQALGVDVQGDNAFVTYGEGGLVIFDIFDPERPRVMSELETEYEYLDVTVSGELAYIAGGQSGMRIVDLSDLEFPHEVGTLNGEAYEIIVDQDDELAYIAAGSGGFKIADVSNPQRPIRIDNVQTGGSIESISVGDGYAYAANTENIVHVIDIRDPRDISVAANQPLTSVKSISLSDDDVLVCGASDRTFGGLHLFDVTNPRSLDKVGFYSMERRILGVELAGEYACLIGDLLWVADISDPVAPVTLGSVELPGSADPLAFIGTYVYVPCGSAGLRIYDVSEPTNPTEAGVFQPDNFSPRDVVVYENLAYSVSQWELWIVDVSDPGNMEPVGYFRAHGRIYYRSIEVRNGFAYIPAHEGGLRILDVSDPRHIDEIAYVDNIGHPSAAVADDEFVYVSSWEGGMWVIDITDPAQPIEVGYCYTPLSRDISKAGNLVYVACEWAGVRVIDVSDPENPVEVGYYYENDSNTKGVLAAGDLVYVAEGNAFGIYEYAAPPNSVETGSPQIPMKLMLNAYPNPFNSTAHFAYNLPVTGNAVVSVFDLTGREVARLTYGVKPAGRHTITWDAAGAAAGTYLIKLDGGGFQTVKMIQLVK